MTEDLAMKTLVYLGLTKPETHLKESKREPPIPTNTNTPHGRILNLLQQQSIKYTTSERAHTKETLRCNNETATRGTFSWPLGAMGGLNKSRATQ